MHNIIQELKGNVRVFARIRPFLPADKANDHDQPCILQKSKKCLKVVSLFVFATSDNPIIFFLSCIIYNFVGYKRKKANV